MTIPIGIPLIYCPVTASFAKQIFLSEFLSREKLFGEEQTSVEQGKSKTRLLLASTDFLLLRTDAHITVCHDTGVLRGVLRRVFMNGPH
jgi:hypothetical protein